MNRDNTWEVLVHPQHPVGTQQVGFPLLLFLSSRDSCPGQKCLAVLALLVHPRSLNGGPEARAISVGWGQPAPE